jgi:hypothetical protein
MYIHGRHWLYDGLLYMYVTLDGLCIIRTHTYDVRVLETPGARHLSSFKRIGTDGLGSIYPTSNMLCQPSAYNTGRTLVLIQ